MKSALYIALTAATFIAEGFGLTCLNCRGIVQPRHCKYVTQCEPFEYCASERVQTEHGEDLYYLGCRPVTNCHNTTGDHCTECCSTDLCNAHSCGEPDYPQQRGPICYNCHDYPAERFCHDISFCDEGEVCSLASQEEFGEVITTRSCALQVTCASGLQGPIIGRRSLEKSANHSDDGRTCDVCCQNDLCNVNCAGHSGAVYNPCSSSPCYNGSTCSSTGVGYTCICPPGVSGKHCEKGYDPCSSGPCNNGTCVNSGSGYTCFCPQGIRGVHCDQAYDPCASSPCNNGTCSNNGSAEYMCHCSPGITGTRCDKVMFRDCQEILISGFSTGSGVYTVYLRNLSLDLEVYCDMDTDGGGWTVFQKRFDGQVDFYRNFSDYEFGFGNFSGEFWLGLRYIHEMTKNQPDLRINLTSSSLRHGYDSYSNFHLLDPPGYNLQIRKTHRNSSFSGSENIYYNVGQPFSTFDHDRDSCAVRDHGGWWYKNCAHANLNGEYITPGTQHHDRGEAGVIYDDFDNRRSLKRTSMMFRNR